MLVMKLPPSSILLPRSPWAWLSGALGLALWLYWSALLAQLPDLGFHYTTNQLYWLAALPPLVTACTRVMAALLPPEVAGSPWSMWATAAALPLAVVIGSWAQQPDTAYEAMVLLAVLCGVGPALFVAAVAPVGAPLAEQAVVLRRRATWVLCGLSLGSLGSLIGLVAASGLLAATQFPQVAQDPALTWGALLCATVLAWLFRHATRTVGPVRITLAAFTLMAVGAAALGTAVLLPSTSAAAAATEVTAHRTQSSLLLIGLSALFAGAALGAHGTFGLATRSFRDAAERRGALALIAALGTFGGFVLPKWLGTSLWLTGSSAAALFLFVAFYLLCLTTVWWCFGRRFDSLPVDRNSP